MSIHQTPPGSRQRTPVSVHQRLGRNRNARSTIDASRRAYNDSGEGARHGNHPRRGRRYDSVANNVPVHLLISLNILEKQTPGFGSKITGLPVKPVVRMMIISLFAISRYSWPIRHEHGWSTYRPTPFRVWRISWRSLYVTSRACINALEIHGTSRTAARRPTKLSASTSNASHGNATSSLTSPTLT